MGSEIQGKGLLDGWALELEPGKRGVRGGGERKADGGMVVAGASHGHVLDVGVETSS